MCVGDRIPLTAWPFLPQRRINAKAAQIENAAAQMPERLDFATVAEILK